MDMTRAEVRQKIDGWFAQNYDNMLADLKKLIAINSVKTEEKPGAPYGTASREVLDVAAQMLQERGFDVDFFEDIVITSDMGMPPVLLGILAHLDIVDAGEGWDTDPFDMTVKDGKILGRGVIDNKGPAVASMYAMYCIKELFPQLKSGLRLILGSGEETGFDDITRYLAKNETPPNVFSPDAEFPVVNTEKGRFAPFFSASWEKDTALPRIISVAGGKTMNIVPHRATAEIEGFTLSEAEGFCKDYSAKTGAEISAVEQGGKLTITSLGKAAHASTPQLGNNAQTALVEMLAAMPFAKSQSFTYLQALNRLFSHGDCNGKALGIAMEDEISGKLTVNFGVLSFSEQDFTANFDSRTPACADSVDIKGITIAALEKENIQVTEAKLSHCHHTPGDSPFVKTLLSVYEEYTGGKGECLITGGQTYVHNIEGGVVFGCGFPGNDYHAHGANEYMTEEQLLVSAKIFTQVILDMCG
ncbi:MAG: Sapep family Mn(2+)-dependent dipeptidase [Oscillospiraceae bacterium]|nr:Sapep family Mn(2+)-dependent dipeptidase [Oscillospiraceae bacterium]